MAEKSHKTDSKYPTMPLKKTNSPSPDEEFKDIYDDGSTGMVARAKDQSNDNKKPITQEKKAPSRLTVD
jgi:hypothetical protein